MANKKDREAGLENLYKTWYTPQAAERITNNGGHLPEDFNLVTMDNMRPLLHDIQDLYPLGRSDAWRAGIDRWAAAIRSAPDNKTLEWAFYQYGIWAHYNI